MTDWKKAAEKVVKEGEIPSDAKADLMNKSKHLLLFALGIIAALIGFLLAIGLAIGLYNWATGHKPDAQASAVQASAPAVQAAASPSPAPSPMPAALTCDTAKADVASITHDGPYAQVRAKLIAAGWIPKGRNRPPMLEDGSEDFATMPAWNAGFQEVESCSGTGFNPCTYRFSDKGGNKLEVVGLGEDPPTQQVDHATVTCSVANGKNGGTKNSSIDLRGPANSPVHSTADGIVGLVGSNGVGGTKYVYVEHGTDIETRYEHLANYRVSIGQVVRKGDVIGSIASDKNAPLGFLRYQVLVSGKTVDPTAYLNNNGTQTRSLKIHESPSNQAASEDKIKQISRALNPSAWARCVAGDTIVLALIARGDQIPPDTMSEHKAIGSVLGALRRYMLTNHIPDANLDSMVRNYGIQIRANPDPLLTAFQIVDQCIGDIAKAAQ